MTLATCSEKSSQCSRRNASFGTEPRSPSSMYARDVRSNLGHIGSRPSFGSPVFAKFVQYCCIVSDSIVSTAVGRAGGPGPPTPAVSSVPKTLATSKACVAPTLSRPGGTRPNSNSYVLFPAAACHMSCITAGHLNVTLFGIEIEQCARCGGRLEVIASIEEPELIERILAHRREQEGEEVLRVALGARAPPQPSLL